MDPTVKTRLARTAAAMVVEAIVLVAVVVGLALGSKIVGAAPLPVVVGALAFVAISLAILTILAPRLAALGGVETQGTGLRGVIATFVLGYAGNGAIHAAFFVPDILTKPHNWADVAILNTLSKTIAVAAEWPATLADLVGRWVG